MSSFLKKGLLIALFFSSNVFADTIHYSIIVDAGSSGSKVHLFQYNIDEKNQFVIKELFSEKNKQGLAIFANHPKDAPLSLKKLLDDTEAQLQVMHIPQKDVTINIYGTAGMRLLPPETQYAIYQEIHSYVEEKYSFKLKEVKTLEGKDEGFDAWLSINYLENNFASEKETLGIIDMGGASTQIAFATRDTSHPEDEYSFIWDKQNYTVFSKSFLGLGLDQARNKMLEDIKGPACFPSGYFKESNNFNFKECSSAYAKVLAPYHIAEQLISFKETKFAVFSGAYYTYTFFGVEDASQGALEARVNTICTMSWEDMKKEYEDSHVPEEFLSAYCANGIFLDNLFYENYHLSPYQMWVTSKTHNKQDIDWSIGALIRLSGYLKMDKL